MLKRFISSLIAVSFFVGAGAGFAGTDHAHDKGPNGGEVKSLGSKYHVEAVRNGREVKLYVLGNDGKGSSKIDQHEGGSLTVISPGSKPEKKEIAKGTAIDVLSATLQSDKKSSVTLSLKVDGKLNSVKFSL